MKVRIFLSTTMLLFCISIFAADHKEAPLVSERPPEDIADLYAFMSPTNAENLVLVMTVNPFNIPGAGGGFNFAPDVRYVFHIDNDGDTVSDKRITLEFDADQTFHMYTSGGVMIQGQATPATAASEAAEPIIASADGVSVFAGPRDDPFFFDFVGFNRVLGGIGGFTNKDSFAGYNVSAIVVEAPAAYFEGDVLNIWATTESRRIAFKNGNKGPFNFRRQFDRMGNPGVSTALIPSGLKDRYNQVSPLLDASEFAGPIVATLQALGTSDENIGVLASVAVPDVLTINVTEPTGFPNGRGLADDVIDTLFFFIFNDSGVSDGVNGNDVEFQDTFPYLAAPWQPE